MNIEFQMPNSKRAGTSLLTNPKDGRQSQQQSAEGVEHVSLSSVEGERVGVRGECRTGIDQIDFHPSDPTPHLDPLPFSSGEGIHR